MYCLKKSVYIIIGIIIIVLCVLGIMTSYYDGARVRNNMEPIYTIKIISYNGEKITYWGLGYKVIRYVGVSPYEPFKNNIGVKYGSWFMHYELEEPIPLKDIKHIIDSYTENNDLENYIDSYIKDNVVVVELIDNDVKKQDDFIYEVFSNTTGSKYIRNIRTNLLIKFEQKNNTL